MLNQMVSLVKNIYPYRVYNSLKGNMSPDHGVIISNFRKSQGFTQSASRNDDLNGDKVPTIE